MVSLQHKRRFISINEAQALHGEEGPTNSSLAMLGGDSVSGLSGVQTSGGASLAQEHSIYEAWAQLKVLITLAAELQINVYLCLATPSLPMLHPSYRMHIDRLRT